MKSRKSSLGTSKKTTVMANTIKRDRSLGPGNRRRSSNQYVVELRMNNAKLATSLANERNKNSKIIQLNTSMREQIVGQQAELRAIAGAARAGLQKFQSALDLMIEASDLIATVNQKIGTLCPELAPVQQPSNLLASSSQSPVIVAPTARTSSSPVGPNTSSVVARVHNKDSSGTSTLTQGTARPMVQGQVISTNPTVPLQRLIVPVPLGRGPQRVPPQRGVDFLSSRLSDISEQSNESSGGDAPSPRSCAPPQSISSSTQPMPESHVLLERLLPASSMSSADASLAKDDDEQLTVVHFGSFSFSEASCIQPAFSSSKQSPVISESIRAVPSLSPQRPAEHSSFMYDVTEAEESSSEDENVALQIVESKKSYLERQRQEDCKEGTSWNYDEAGKFHKRPPRKRRSKRAKSPTSQSHGDAVNSRNSNKTADQLNESSSSVSRSSGTIETPIESVEGACVHLEKSDPLDISDITSHDAIDMSFTCVTSKQQKNLLLKNLVNNQESNDEMPESLDNSFNEDEGGRKVFVTQRSRRKRSASDNHLSPRIGSLSPLNINKNITASDIENNENSPPTLSQRSVTYDKIFSHHKEVILANHQEISPRASFVVLERLPSNIISGNIIPPTPVNCTDSVILKKKKKCTAPDKASKQNEASCASESNLENKHAISPISPNRKRSLSETQISPIRTGSIDAQFNRNNRPGPKQSKQRKKKRDNEISLESAPTSPASSRNGDTSECESVDLEGSKPRPRRNAAPVNLKEPKLSTKMRRQ